MKEERIRDVKELFFRVKQFYYGSAERTEAALAVSAGEVSDYVSALWATCATCLEEQKGDGQDAGRMLARVAGLIADALQERDYRLAGDLADAGIRLTGVYSFPYLSRKGFVKKVLWPLREKHGDQILGEEEAEFLSLPDEKVLLRPSFRTPREEGHYVTEHADDSLRYAHPALYFAFLFVGALVFFGAIVGYSVLTVGTLGKSGGFVLPGLFGSFLFGIGLFSLLMTFVRQYMGHIATLLLLVGGGVLMGLSWLLM